MAEASKAKGSLATNNAEHQSAPSLYLGHEHLAKFGIKDMPKVGSKIKISGLAHVGSTSESSHAAQPGESEGSGPSTPQRSMTLHIHSMEVGKNGVNDVEQEAQTAKGAKAAMDKELTKRAGTESSKAKTAGGKLGGQGG
jgi:hypothetical protein